VSRAVVCSVSSLNPGSIQKCINVINSWLDHCCSVLFLCLFPNVCKELKFVSFYLQLFIEKGQIRLKRKLLS
jgi:hypothetical protein